MQFTEAPPQDLWRVFQANFAQLHGQVRSLADELISAKVNRAKETAADEDAEAAAAVSAAGIVPANAQNRRKSTFAPTASTMSTVGNPLAVMGGRSGKAAAAGGFGGQVSPSGRPLMMMGPASGGQMKLSQASRRTPGLAARLDEAGRTSDE
jgi:hypothetical protein